MKETAISVWLPIVPSGGDEMEKQPGEKEGKKGGGGGNRKREEIEEGKKETGAERRRQRVKTGGRSEEGRGPRREKKGGEKGRGKGERGRGESQEKRKDNTRHYYYSRNMCRKVHGTFIWPYRASDASHGPRIPIPGIFAWDPVASACFGERIVS